MFFVRFLVAKVLSVSTVAVEGRAVVMAVSWWPASVVAVVASSPRRCFLCAKKFAPRGLMWARARKSSPCKPKMAEKHCFQACWANFFAEVPAEGLRWANFFADRPLEAPCWANYFADRSKDVSCWASFFAGEPLEGPLPGEFFADQQSRGSRRANFVARGLRGPVAG